MKLFFLFLFLLTLDTSATVQDPDILIIEEDTVFLKTFPLEDLELQYRPFGLTYETAPTACWRGYQAVWRLQNDSLFLEKILTCPVFRLLQNDSLVSGEVFSYYSMEESSNEQDVLELFRENGLEATVVKGRIFAGWYTKKLVGIETSKSVGKNVRRLVPQTTLFEASVFQSRGKKKGKRRLRKEKERITLSFNQGVVVVNKLKD